ncbi:VWA domain-containing protein [Candidatus Woesearchaeota archaeon]|nr:VWA domain-containing protein [Candidatus Woesearchaeota archaeon]
MWTIDFAKPVFLWLLVLIPMLIGAHFFFLKRTQVKALKFANFMTLKRISGERMVTKNVTVLILRTLTILAFIIGLAGTSIWYDGLRNDFDYVIAIDTSSSMSARDMVPTRLDAAKEAANIFVNTLDSSSKVGVISFSGVTYVVNPLTSEFIPLKMKINSLNLSRVSGTDISGAIVTATNMFSDDSRGKAIILLTDGSDTVGAYMENNILAASNYAASKHVTIHGIGLGDEDTLVGYLPEDFNLTVGIDKGAIALMANTTGGDEVYPKTTDELVSYFEEVNSRSHEAKLSFDLGNYALIVGFILLMVEWILINLTFRRVV